MNLKDLGDDFLNHVGEGIVVKPGNFAPVARAIVFRIVVDGQDYWVVVNHGHYPTIARHVKAAYEGQYGTDYDSFEVVESYELDVAGRKDMGWRSSHAKHPEIQALTVDPTPNYNGQVHEIDGRKYRLEALD